MNHPASDHSNIRIEQMNSLLAALQPTKIEIVDDSHKHAGHVGARGGGGHYRLLIVSPQFTSMPTLTRHRMVYSALGDMMKHEIHALAIAAYTPEEI
ncbi:Cell division protein BolA [Candidatus Nitrotoga sp. BS]|uniref:BolA family protein n=1 Tax=Candidatus Nitrotoga sp. BS TaxID=2890408 RepID=UPI001EF3BEB7|nr:BolA family protein [Candidatus Nitrotoga sp. BS]CAH1207430.1 Cell division protein BolA [Candidatus Nitrotoga sp. BS]